MPGKIHELIVDEIRFGFRTFVRKYYPMGDRNRPWVTPDGMFFQTLCGFHARVGDNLPKADVYLGLGDGADPVMAEVGNMRDGKWSRWTAEDESPVRVLRCGFDGSVWLLNSRSTQAESALLEYYGKVLRSALRGETPWTTKMQW